jgi:hypothetical protein
MIVIVASRYDAAARRLKERWAGAGAGLLTCDDLSVSGWRCRVGDLQDATAVIDGLAVRATKISGVYTRLQWVADHELTHIVAEDRGYISAEMSAFLVFWLSGLTCSFLNRPSASSLTGPGWGREAWNSAASRAGMRINPIRRQSSLADVKLASATAGNPQAQGPGDAIVLTVVGDSCLGDADETLKRQALRLAEIAQMNFVNIKFSSGAADAVFAGVDIFPDIDDETVADAALGYFAVASARLISNPASAAAIGWPVACS